MSVVLQHDAPLLQKVADKSFITPTAFRQYLNDIYNNTIHQLENSKAKLVDDVRKQLEANYQHQLRNVSEKSAGELELNKRELEALKQQLQNERNEKVAISNKFQDLQKDVAAKSKIPVYVSIVLLIVAMFFGWLVGKVLA